MESRVIGITDEICSDKSAEEKTDLLREKVVLTENTASQDLSAHGNEQGKVEHVTSANEPVHEKRCQWRPNCEGDARGNSSIGKQGKQGNIQ
jgi:hypothetical protein